MAGRRDFFKKLIGGAVAGAAIASAPKTGMVSQGNASAAQTTPEEPPKRYSPFAYDPSLVCVSTVSMIFNQPMSYVDMANKNRRARS